jgi:hypothetical protein
VDYSSGRMEVSKVPWCRRAVKSEERRRMRGIW